MAEIWLDVARAAIVVALALVTMLTGGRLVLAVFKHIDQRRASEPHPEGTPPSIMAASIRLKGGAWVGLLERLAVFAGLMAGFPEAIAIALAIKGLARYPELQATNDAAAERFIIGTFVSVLYACACAGMAQWLIGLF